MALATVACGENSPVEPRAAAIEVNPATVVLVVGESRTLTAVVTDGSGNALTDETVTWTASATAVATVTEEGTVTAAAYAGPETRAAYVIASAGSAVDSARVEVTPSPVARVEASATNAVLAPWETAQISVIPYDEAGNELTGRAVSWSNADSSIVAVDTSGTALALYLGGANVIAAVGDAADTVAVTVDTPTPVWVSPNIDVAPGVWAAETSVAVNPKEPLNIVVSSNYGHFSSFDGGRTWSHIEVVGGQDAKPAVDPNVVFDADGIMLRQGLNRQPNHARSIVVQRSIDGGRTLPSSLRVMAYQPPAEEGGMDQGIIASDNAESSPFRGNAYVIGSDYISNPPYDRTGFGLVVLTSQDGGATWSPPVDITNSSTGWQEANSFIETGPAGEVYAAWLSTLDCKVYFDRSLDGGYSWGQDLHVHTCAYADAAHPTSDDVRGNPTIAVDLSDGPYGGTIYLTATDSKAPNGAADTWIRKSTDGGATWSEPLYFVDGPKGPFNYYFQPRISVAPNGRLDAVWYDTRHWGGNDVNEVLYDVYYAYSTDGGESFSPGIRVTPSSTLKKTSCPTNQSCGERHLFEYLGLASDDARAVMAWTDLRSGSGRVAYAVVWHRASDD